jgi:hypothetical protein
MMQLVLRLHNADDRMVSAYTAFGGTRNGEVL